MTAPSPKPRYDLCGPAHDYPEWVGPPRRSILVCSYARSGSTMLGEALYFAGGLGCALEYLHVGFRPGFEARWGVTGLRPLTRQVWRHRTDPDGTMAVKLFWRDVVDLVEDIDRAAFPDLRTVPADVVPPETYRALDALLRDLFPNPIHVHLERRDRLRQAVSGLAATQTNVWRRIATVEGDGPAAAVDYDFDRIGELIASNAFCQAHWRAFFRANAIAPHPVVYEDMVAEYAGVVERLLAALGRPGPAPAARMERQSSSQTEALMRRFLADQRAVSSPNRR